MIADIIAGFGIALLSGMGVGSAGLLVVWLTMADTVPQLAAQGLNLYFFLFSSGASLCVHLRRRRIYFGLCALMLLPGIAGALAGSYLSSLLNAALLRRLFGGMLSVCGVSGLAGVVRRYFTSRKISRKNQ